MHQTVELALEGRAQDVQVVMDPDSTPEHVKRFTNQNWSYGFSNYPYSGDSSELENLSDMDSMAVKMTVD